MACNCADGLYRFCPLIFNVSLFGRLIAILLASCLTGTCALMTVEGIVGSTAILKCESSPALDIETVHWKMNSSDDFYLVYFPKDKTLQPTDHDQRYSMLGETDLVISSLVLDDDGTYVCTITSPVSEGTLVSAVQLIVMDGCIMWNYNPPLFSEADCKPGAIIEYQERCNFSCLTGFQLIGENSSTECQGSGVLTGSLPRCKEITCSIRNLPPHLIDEGESCLNGSQTSYGQTCSFSCEPGYDIVGQQTVSCLESGIFDTNFPTCSENQSSNNITGLWGIFAIVIVPIIAIAAFLCMKHRRTRQEENRNREKGAEIPLLDKDGDDFPFLVNDQIKKLTVAEKRKVKARIVTIMRSVENKLIQDLPTMESPIDISDRRKMSQRCPDTPTAEEAFAWYIYMILSFIENKEEVEMIKQHIVTATFPLNVDPPEDIQSVKSVKSVTAQHVRRKENINEYYDIVHSAFAKLLAIERSSLDEEVDKRERTAKVANTLSSFQKKVPPSGDGNNEIRDEDGLPSDWKSSLGSSSDAKGHMYFAEMCVKSINRCSSVRKALALRYEILNIFYS